LQHSVEELDAANEELQTGDEEAMASNVELQSTNEELHAVNEELYTVNAEHEFKIRELQAATADLNNLIYATEIAILFLDSQAKLRMFTPTAVKLFPLQPGDVGRDLRHFMPRESDDKLAEDISQALEHPQTIERELRLRSGEHLVRRLLPYRDGRGAPDGLVITYQDVSRQVELTNALTQREAQTRAIVESVQHLMWTSDATGTCDYLSPQWVEYTGIPEKEQLGSGWLQQVHPDDHCLQLGCNP
jgi:two-component system, chemotaxis family, CheB/CheR fusion protein